MTPKELWLGLAEIMESVSGEDVTSKTRREPVPILRFMVWRRMREAGLSSLKIAVATGWNSATIRQGCITLQYAIDHPLMYWDIMDNYYKFNKEADAYIHERTTGVPLAV